MQNLNNDDRRYKYVRNKHFQETHTTYAKNFSKIKDHMARNFAPLKKSFCRNKVLQPNIN